MRLRFPLLLAFSLFWLGCGHASSTHGPGNRDLHGPPNVDRYIEALRSEERVRELNPEGVIESVGLPSDAIVADVGSGPGVFSVPLARHLSSGLVYAVDVEPLQLDALRSRLLSERIENVVPVLASYSDAHLPPRGIEWIFIVDTYHHFEDRVTYLRGLRGDLTAGGRLVILEYKPGDLPVGPPADHKISLEQRFAELEEAGFELVTSFETRQYHDFELWRSRSSAP